MYLRTNQRVFFLLPTAAIGWDVDDSWFFEVAWLNFALGVA
jgi:hypothetical protein